MEKNLRMSKRWWLLGLVGLVLAGLLIACGSNYSSSSDGLLVVGSQGSGLLETFSFSLNNGHISPIYNTPVDTNAETCVLNGLPGSMVMGPGGTYVYAIIQSNSSCGSGSATGLMSFQVNPDGTLGSPSSLLTLNQTNPTVQVSVNECGSPVPVSFTETSAVVPNAITMDPAGKFLFVANVWFSDTVSYTYTCGGQSYSTNVGVPEPGTVSVLAIGSGGTLTEVPGSPFSLPSAPIAPSLVALAASPTVFPGIGLNGTENSVCSVGQNPPTAEYLYAVDSQNYVVWEFAVNTSTGVLSSPDPPAAIPSFKTDAIPAGVAVDPCDRFVYVTGSLHNNVSAYTICDGLPTASTTCTSASLVPGALVEVVGSPFSLGGAANGPGPVVEDPYGNYVYVLDTLSNTISQFKIAPVTGSIAALNPATAATGIGPVSMTIRSDDNWLFVANYGSIGNGGNTVSQYSITPATGELGAQQAIPTDNYPWGVAVK